MKKSFKKKLSYYFSTKFTELKESEVVQNFRLAPKRYLSIIVNSTTVYIITYLITLIVYNTTTVILGASYNIQMIYSFNKILYITSGKANVWNQDSIITIFSFGPLITFFIGVICLILFITQHRKYNDYLQFYVWGFIQVANRIISLFVIGLIFTLWGSNLIVDWLYFDRDMKIIFSAFSILLLLGIGSISTTAIIYTADSPMIVKKESQRITFLLSSAIIPAILGNFMLFFLFIPKINFIEIAIAFSSIIMLIPTLFGHKNFRVIEAVSILGKDIRNEIFIIRRRNILFLIAFYIIYRVVFWKEFFI